MYLLEVVNRVHYKKYRSRIYKLGRFQYRLFFLPLWERVSGVNVLNYYQTDASYRIATRVTPLVGGGTRKERWRGVNG